MSDSLKQKIYSAVFGQRSTTETTAEQLQSVIQSEQGFVERALQVFNLRIDLVNAYKQDKRALRAKNIAVATPMLYSVSFGALTMIVAGICLASASPAVVAGAVCCGVVGATVAGVGLLQERRMTKVLDSVRNDLHNCYEQLDSTAETAIRDMQKSLAAKAPEVRTQFNDAYQIYLARADIASGPQRKAEI